MIANAAFYHKLPPISALEAVFAPDNHQPAPADWYIALTDVVNSTHAIKSGRYKDVNTAGGLAAMAIANAIDDMDFPFIFGGDGLVGLIPPVHVNLIHDILFDTSEKVKTFFDLELRVGLIPVHHIYTKNLQIEVAKLAVSEYYNQAIISGEGLLLADEWLKIDSPDNPYRITRKKNSSVEADFTGFTCRWQDIPSSLGETIATIIELRQPKQANHIFPKILTELQQIFGTEEKYHPVQEEQMQISQKAAELGTEAKVISGKSSGWRYYWHLLRYRFEAFITALALRWKLPIRAGWYDLSDLKKYQSISSDYQKYDGRFKIVLNGSSTARKEWEDFLENAYQAGEVYYGLHVADRALMTCLLHANSQREVHFIDAADGGYALAAVQLKKQIKANN